MRHDHFAAREHGFLVAQDAVDEFVGQAMETVAAHALVVIGARQRVGVGDERMPAMKSRVETGDLRGAGKSLARGLDAGEIVGLVQRRQRLEGFQFRQHEIVHEHGFGIDRTAMHHAMADADHIGAVAFRFQPVEHGGEPRAMVHGVMALVEIETGFFPAGFFRTEKCALPPMPSIWPSASWVSCPWAIR